MVGHRLRRREDAALLRGEGRFLDDIKLPDMLHVAFVRSPHAHALIRSIDAGDARAMRGVIAIYTADDLRKTLVRLRLPMAFPEGKLTATAMPFVLAAGEVCYVGEALAMVVATSRYLAEDAADRVARGLRRVEGGRGPAGGNRGRCAPGMRRHPVEPVHTLSRGLRR